MKYLKGFFFLLGSIAGALVSFFLFKKFDEPETIINNNVENKVGKVKVKGKGNTQDVAMENDSVMDIAVDNSKKKKKFLGIFGKKKKNK